MDQTPLMWASILSPLHATLPTNGTEPVPAAAGSATHPSLLGTFAEAYSYRLRDSWTGYEVSNGDKQSIRH